MKRGNFTKKNITILNFSPREHGNCRSINDAIQAFYENSNVRSFSVSTEFNACGNCDYECLKPEVRCPSLTEEQAAVYDSIRQSDLVYYIIPNFCGMPNSVYYAFNERSVGYFNMDRAVMDQYMAVRKRFVFVSNTETNPFAEVMRQQAKEPYEALYLKTGRYGKKSIAGDLMDSEEARADLMAFLDAATL